MWADMDTTLTYRNQGGKKREMSAYLPGRWVFADVGRYGYDAYRNLEKIATCEVMPAMHET